MRAQLVAAVRAVLVFTVLLGLVYPLVVTGVAQLAFDDEADGSLVEARRRGRRVPPDRPGLRRRRVVPASTVGGGRRLRRHGQQRLEPRAHQRDAARQRRRTGRGVPSGERARRRRLRCPSTRSPRRARASTRTSRSANARLQAPRVARRPRSRRRRRARPRRRPHRAADVSASSARTGVNVLELNLALDEARVAGDWRRGPRHAPRLPRRRARRRQDLRHAQRGPAAPRPRHRRGRRLRRDPRPAPDRRADRRPRGRAPPLASSTGGTTFEEMDVDAVLARRPEVALVDELAHTNVPGSRNAKRWQDVERAARRRHRRHLHGQHPAPRVDQRRRRAHHRDRAARDDPRRDRARRRPGRAGRHDARGAAPAHGARQHLRAREDRRRARQLLPRRQPRRAARARAAVGRRPGRRGASRSTAQRHGITEPWETRERVVVAITGAPGTEDLIRRAARIAQRAHGELLGVHVRSAGRPGRAGHRAARRAPAAARGARRRVPRGGRRATSPPPSSTSPRAENATQLVLGEQPPEPLERADPRLGHQPRRAAVAGPIDVHVISHEPRRSRRRAPAARRAAAWRSPLAAAAPARVAASPLVGLPVLTLGSRRSSATTSGCRPCSCCTSCSSSSTPRSGGSRRRLVAAVAGFLRRELVLHAAHPHVDDRRGRERDRARRVPRHRGDRQRPRRPRRPAAQPRPPGPSAEAETLSALASGVVDADPLPTLMSHLRRSFGLSGVALLRRTGRTAGRSRPPTARASPTRRTADDVHAVGAELVLGALRRRPRGRGPPGAQRVRGQPVGRPRSTPAAARRPRRRARSPRPTSCAARCSRPCRTTCARRSPASRRRSTASANPTSTWTADETAGVPRHHRGRDRPAHEPRRQPARHEPHPGRRRDARAAPDHARRGRAGRARRASAHARRDVVVDVAETLPPVHADPALLERVVANLVDNALTHGDSTCPVRVEAGAVGDRVLAAGHRPRPRHPPATTESASSSRSSASTTPPRAAVPGSGSAWPSPAASPGRWAASSTSRTRPAAARRWSSSSRPCP